MRGILLALSSALVCVAAPCAAQSKSVQLSKVVLDTESVEIKGKVKGGTLCVFPQKLAPLKQKKSQDYERYDGLFSEKMKSSGFNVVTTSADLFADQDAQNSADFLVGATIRPDTINLCSSVKGEKGDVTLAVEWQIYDRASHKVVATVTTTGQATQEKFARTGMTEMWNRAFLVNLGALIEKGVLQDYVGKSRP